MPAIYKKPMMIFFFTTITVIVPAMVLMGLVIFATHDAREHGHARIPHDKKAVHEWPE
jgi:hypothetical protein